MSVNQYTFSKTEWEMVGVCSPFLCKIHYLSGGNGLAAIYVQNNGKDSLMYAYTDNQGSLAALTDESGNVIERYAYDPWGARRNPDDWTQKDSRNKWITNRGYTLHEHLDAFGIINMNGRVYDPQTAMFFSPDPFVQAPDNWVNYNRYGYCLNNPLIYSDPSGYEFEASASSAWRILENGGSWQDFSNALIYGSSGGSSGNYSGGGGGWYNNNYGAPMDYYYNNGKFYNEHGDQVSREEYIAGNTIAYTTGPNAVLLLMHYGYIPQNNSTKVYDSNGQFLGNRINNFGGIKGLTVYVFNKYTHETDEECPSDHGGVEIRLSYTGADAVGARWAQYYVTNDSPGEVIIRRWDDDDTNNGYYYTDSELLVKTVGNTISFYDEPNSRFVDTQLYYNFSLFLFNSNGNLIFKLWYGYSNSGKQDGAVTTTINGLTVGYP